MTGANGRKRDLLSERVMTEIFKVAVSRERRIIGLITVSESGGVSATADGRRVVWRARPDRVDNSTWRTLEYLAGMTRRVRRVRDARRRRSVRLRHTPAAGGLSAADGGGRVGRPARSRCGIRDGAFQESAGFAYANAYAPAAHEKVDLAPVLARTVLDPRPSAMRMPTGDRDRGG